MNPSLFFVLATVLVLAAGIVGYMIGHHEKSAVEESMPSEAGIVDRETFAMLEEMRSAVERNPLDTQAVLRYANALHDTKRIDEAIEQYRAYLALKPDDPDAGIDLGVCYFEKRDFEAAASQMRSVLTRHPRHQLGAYNFGIVLMHTGRIEEARDWLRKAVDIDPTTTAAANAKQVLENLEREPG
ncbi:MAG: tetratricopeptide repeat protein [Bacteroidota bacterium]|nr:tetratricopeptide repeat protein [Bacteroidota bacterium]